MGNILVRKFCGYVKQRLEHTFFPERSSVWLSHILLYWVWEKDSNNILEYTEILKDEFPTITDKCVSDLIYIVKKYRHRIGNVYMTEEERERFRAFMVIRRRGWVGDLKIEKITTPYLKSLEYINNVKWKIEE
jgi:hypothetical protein